MSLNYRQPFEGDYGISQHFGETTTDPKGHTGIDYLCPSGTPILASESGTVIHAGWKNGGYGYCVFIHHADGNMTIYEHLSPNIPVKVGQYVKRSQVIGYSASTGNSTGPHLHFEVHDKDGKAFDPVTVLHSSIEPATGIITEPDIKPVLENADQLGDNVEVICSLGAKGWNNDFTRFEIFPQGTKLTYTGETTDHNGYQYCLCYPEPKMYWVAVNDHIDQILANNGD